MLGKRTDLALEAAQAVADAAGLEGVEQTERTQDGVTVTVVELQTQEAAQRVGKPVGRYVTLDLGAVRRREKEGFQRACQTLAEELAKLLPEGTGTVLVVGLGNRAITPDAVGPKTCDHLLVTRHLVESIPEHFGHLRPVAAAAPGVLASTGMESSLIAQALSGELRPACVVAVDALASRSLDRLCRTVQLSDTGVIPGSGVGNHRRPLNRETLGVPVLTVGVPTVVDGATLALDLLERAGRAGTDRGDLPGGEEFFVTPREVDQRVADMGKVLGYAVSLALNPSLSLDDLVMLLE